MRSRSAFSLRHRVSAALDRALRMHYLADGLTELEQRLAIGITSRLAELECERAVVLGDLGRAARYIVNARGDHIVQGRKSNRGEILRMLVQETEVLSHWRVSARFRSSILAFSTRRMVAELTLSQLQCQWRTAIRRIHRIH